MASMSVSWMSALLMAAGDTHTHAHTHAHTHTHTHTQVRHTCCSRVKQMTGDRGVEVTVVRDELLVLMAEDEHVVF